MATASYLLYLYHGSVALLFWWFLPQAGIMFGRGSKVDVDACAGDVDLPVRPGVAVVVLEVVNLPVNPGLHVGFLVSEGAGEETGAGEPPSTGVNSNLQTLAVNVIRQVSDSIWEFIRVCYHSASGVITFRKLPVIINREESVAKLVQPQLQQGVHLRDHPLLGVVLEEGVPRGPALGGSSVQTIREEEGRRESNQEEIGGE